MEFSRFGGNITNKYWGCCACDIIQDFNHDPDAKASIQLVDGDGGTAILSSTGEQLFAGPTYKDIFLQRLRFGTFSTRDMPNHAFLAILTQNQLQYGAGAKWLPILKEAGFEFIRTINNSVYTGQTLLGEEIPEPEYDEYGDPIYDDDEDCDCEELGVHGASANYLFGLFRNIGRGAATNPFEPPKEWVALSGGSPEGIEFIAAFGSDVPEFVKEQQAFQLEAWDKLPKQDTLLTEAQLREKDVPVWLSGRRAEDHKPKIKPKDKAVSKQTSLRAEANSALLKTDVAPLAAIFSTGMLANPAS